ncbi:type VI secretion system tip protein VgrG, partial [Pseudomonas sp. LS_2]
LGREEVFIHAQRDQNNVVQHDETTQVGNDRKEQVGRDETTIIGNDRGETVGNDERITIGQDRFVDVGRNQICNIGKDRLETVGNHRQDRISANHSIKIGGNLEQLVEGYAELEARQAIRRRTRLYELRAGEAIVLRGPGGSICIDDTGITLDGPSIRIKGEVHQTLGATTNPFAIHSAPVSGKPLERLCGRRFDGTCDLPDCRCLGERSR